MNVTPEQIRALRAGIEADRLAAEYVMGWKWYWWQGADGIHIWRKLVSPDRAPHPSYKPWSPADGEMPVWDFGPDLPAYSSSWDAMEQIVIQMRLRGWRWTLFCNEMEGDKKPWSKEPWFEASFSKPALFISGEAKASGAPLAVVKAALLALIAEREASNG